MKVSAILGYTPSDIDEAAVARALGILIQPGTRFEIRGHPTRSPRVCDTIEQGVEAARSYAGSEATWYTINACRPDLDHYANEADIIARRWLLVDVDPIRPDKSNATEAEKQNALDVAYAILQHHSAGRGWPSPLIVDSGNGIHLLWQCDLPADKLTKQIIKGWITGLARFQGEHTIIDRLFRNSQLAKLPGTWARKGPHSEERPHRKCELLWTPSTLECVTLDQIKAELPAETSKPAGPLPSPARAAITSIERYCQRALESAACAVLLAQEGTRHNILRDQAYALAGYLHTGGITEFELRRVLRPAGIRCGLADKEVDDLIDSGIIKGREAPRSLPAELRAQVVAATRPGPEADEDEAPEQERTTGNSGREYRFPLIVRGATVEAKQVNWMWRDRIPYGFLTLIAGRTGIGKSFVTLDLASRVTTGREVPFGNGEKFAESSVLIISEDSHEYMLAPRLIEVETNMDRVSFMSWEAMASFELADTQMLDDTYHAAGCPKMVVIDPPTNFLGNKDEHRNAEVRSVLMKCSIWAMQHTIACLMITHCNKGGKKDMAALDRVIGSVAWASTSRIAHIFGEHPDKPHHAVFVPLKNNLGPTADGITYRIDQGEICGKVNWVEVWEGTGDDLLGGKKKTKPMQAIEWLMERFRLQREWPSSELRRDALEAGLNKDALWDPRVQGLPIRKTQINTADGGRHWVWQAEEGWPPPSESSECSESAP